MKKFKLIRISYPFCGPSFTAGAIHNFSFNLFKLELDFEGLAKSVESK